MDDVIIVGGSAGATAAGIYLARRNMKFRIVSADFGGEVAVSGEIGNYPGFPMTDGIKLTDEFRAHLQSYHVAPELDVQVTSVKKVGEGHFVIEGKKNGNGTTQMAVHLPLSVSEGKKNGASASVKYEARAVIVATGSKPRQLGVPGEKEFKGKGLSYCTVCDGPLFGGKVVAVIGGGDSASESGIMMNEIARKVYVVTKNPDMKGDPSLIARVKTGKNIVFTPNALTTRITGKNFVTGMEYQTVLTKETKTLEVEGVFIHIGMLPNSDFLPPEVSKNAYGEVVVDKNCMTSVAGIFAAGDVTEVPFKQIGVATGQGIIAALAAVTYVNKLSA